MPRLTADKWAAIQAEYEAGDNQSVLAVKHGVSRRAIQKRIETEAWTQDIDPAIRRKVAEKVAGKVAPCDPKKTAELMDAEAERRAGVEIRHREEPNACRELINAALLANKNAKTLEKKRLAFEDLKAAKIATEAMQNVENMERKSWRLDAPDTGASAKIEINVVYVKT